MFEVRSADFRRESPLFGQELKELASFSEFQDNKWSNLLRFVVKFDLGLFPMIDDVDEVLEVKFAEEVCFNFKGFDFVISG